MKDKTLEAGRLRDETQHSGEGRTLGLHQGKMLRGNVSSAGPNSNSGVGKMGGKGEGIKEKTSQTQTIVW